MNEQEQKQRVKSTFDAVATGYDCEALRFFNSAAALLPTVFDFQGNESVLDVCAGTGTPALAMAACLPHGSVTAVDLSEAMLSQAAEKCHKAGLGNVRFHSMDMTQMQFADGTFDAANCSFGVFFVEDMVGALRHITSKVKPGGVVVTTHFRTGSFGRLADMFARRAQAFGIEVSPPGWMKVATEEQNIALFQESGLVDCEVTHHDLGYFLEGPGQWWDVIWNAGYRGLIAGLDEVSLARFKQEHLEEVAELMTPDGLRFDLDVLVTRGYCA